MRKQSWLFLILALVLTAGSVFPAAAEDASALRGYSKSAGYEYVLFGAYPTEEDGTVKPILWRVLRAQDGEAWLLSEYILFAAPVHGDHQHYSGWEASDLYRYLNETFLSDAFAPSEQAALLIRTEDNARVTLITSDEMKDASIGFSSNNDRLCESTAYASVAVNPPIFELPDYNYWKETKNQPHLFKYQKGGFKYSPWWSRTRSTDYPTQHRRVMDEGKIGRVSTGNSDLGVRPAITVDLNKLAFAAGSGSFADPYQLISLAAAPAPQITEEPDMQPQLTEAPAPGEATAEKPQATEAPAQQAAALPQETAPAPIASSASFSAAADPARIHEKFPALTSAGFLPDGEAEFVYADDAEGLWLYASQTLRIEINRRTGQNSKKQPLRWYEAQIFTRDASERFDFFPYDEAHYTSYGDRYKALADKIAAQHHLVFGINSDYFIYRVERDREESYAYPIGLEIRDGSVLYDRPKKPNSTVYPPLDVMALYPDGTVSLHKNATVTAKELLAAGATDTLSFGPILVENGEVSPRSKEFGNTPNPRTAFGIVQPGYYIAVVVESRIAESKGESCVWLGEKMGELGCESAINLDGGATSTMIFMGKQVNKSGNYGDITNRTQNELFGIGHSDAVQ